MSVTETFFVVAVNKDGTITTFAELPEEPLTRERVATNYDVYQTAKQIVDEFESNITADKVAARIVALMSMGQETPADVVKEALRERNINPESAPSN